METKIKIKSVLIKKQTDKWTIREVETDDGKKYDTFDDLKEGQEYSGEIFPNDNIKYNANFKLLKVNSRKNFGPKDYTALKKICALNNAVALVCAGKITTEQIIPSSDKFLSWLNSKSA